MVDKEKCHSTVLLKAKLIWLLFFLFLFFPSLSLSLPLSPNLLAASHFGPLLLISARFVNARHFDGFANPTVTSGNPDAKRLYDDLLSNYNKLVRPVVNVSDALTVRIKLKLSQLIDVNLKNQIMTTNLWVEQSWFDYKLKWEPREYGGVEMLHVPSDHIWRPDIVVREANLHQNISLFQFNNI